MWELNILGEEEEEKEEERKERRGGGGTALFSGSLLKTGKGGPGNEARRGEGRDEGGGEGGGE